MKSMTLTKTSILFALMIVIATLVQPVQAYSGIPTTSIVTVVKDTSVTLQTYNFPANENFTVRMGAYGTLGIGGTVIENFNSGTGGAFQRTFSIPAALVGSNMIAIRFDGSSGHYSYNWFYNSNGNVPTTTTPSTTTPGYTGVPTISIVSVATGTSVTIQTNNFPANVDFTVRMGAYGTLGVGGTVIETFNSGTGGVFQKTFTIPAGLVGSSMIAIRMDSSNGYYYAYNWFYNTTSTTTTTTPVPTTTYTGVPTFSIVSVVKDVSVTIQTYNFPPNETFTCRMGNYGTLAAGGTICGTAPTGSGGSFSLTFTIPADMLGKDMIAIRLDSSTGFYYAYNWFYNVSTY